MFHKRSSFQIKVILFLKVYELYFFSQVILIIGNRFKFNVEKNLLTLMFRVVVLEILFFFASVDNLGPMFFIATLFLFCCVSGIE